MSKEKSTEVQKVEIGNINVIDGKAIIDKQQGAAILAQLKGTKEVSITAEYLELEEGESVVGVIVEKTTMQALPPKEGKVDAIKLMIDDGKGQPKFVMTASTMLVANLITYEVMTPVSITYLGLKEGKKFKYDNYEVCILIAQQ
jgi:hypothetical protein